MDGKLYIRAVQGHSIKALGFGLFALRVWGVYGWCWVEIASKRHETILWIHMDRANKPPLASQPCISSASVRCRFRETP